MNVDDYVVRAAKRGPDGRVDVSVVDGAGALVHVVIPFDLTGAEDSDRIIRSALALRHRRYKPVT